uniref:Uncharacterized protein n=1 Tax=Pavo cristatus TaxID=9049 RepID=A0A8C9L338_PAVCR
MTRYLLVCIFQKTHVKSICLQYQLYLLLNSHFFCLLKNKTGLTIFFLCVYVPKTEANHCKWSEVLKDLELIKTSEVSSKKVTISYNHRSRHNYTFSTVLS